MMNSGAQCCRPSAGRVADGLFLGLGGRFGSAVGVAEGLRHDWPVGLVLAELILQDCALGHQLAIAVVVADAGAQLGTYGIRVGTHLLCLAFAYAQVIDQFMAINGVALIQEVFVDGPWGTDAALFGDLFQHLAQFILLIGGRLGSRGGD